MKYEKTMAFVSYLTLLGLLIIYPKNNPKNSFVSFHIRQSLGLWLTFFILGNTVGNFDSWWITLLFWAFFMVLIFYGISSALTGKTTALPLVGKFYQNIFKNLH